MLQTNQELTESVKLEPVQTAEQEADGRRGCSRSTKQAGAPSGSAPPVILKITGDTQKSKLKSEELGATNSSSPDAKTTRSLRELEQALWKLRTTPEQPALIALPLEPRPMNCCSSTRTESEHRSDERARRKAHGAGSATAWPHLQQTNG